MAEQRRMFSSSVLNTDEFAELSAAAKVLYFAMNMEADDYGFLKCVKQVMRMQNAKQKDLDALKAAGFILCFDSGVVVIRHWNVHNCIRPDRKRDTAFKDEFRRVTLNECKVYELTDAAQENPKNSPQPKENQQPLSAVCPADDGQMSAVCPPDDGQMTDKCPHSTVQVSTVQGSTGKESTGEVSPEGKERELKTGAITLSSLGGTSRGTPSETEQRTLPPRELAASQALSSLLMMQQGTAFHPSLSMPDGREFSSVNGMNGQETQGASNAQETAAAARAAKWGAVSASTSAQRATVSSDEPSDIVKMAQEMAHRALYGAPTAQQGTTFKPSLSMPDGTGYSSANGMDGRETNAPNDADMQPAAESGDAFQAPDLSSNSARKSPVKPVPASSCDPYVYPTEERLAASEAMVRAAFERLRQKKEREGSE